MKSFNYSKEEGKSSDFIEKNWNGTEAIYP